MIGKDLSQTKPRIARAIGILLNAMVDDGLRTGESLQLDMDGVSVGNKSFGRVVIRVEWHG